MLAAGDPALRPSSDLADAVALLEGLDGLDPAQDGVRRRILTFLADHPDALTRASADGHLTGSALVVEAGTGRVLLLLHRKLQRWLQPGGHADGDSNLAAVALREATEETGLDGLAVDPEPLDLDVHRVAPPGEPPHLHLDVRFLVVAPPGATPVGNHESDGLRWVDVNEDLGPYRLDDGTVRLLAAGRERLGTGPAAP